VVAWHDLTALPCSHPHCASVGYMLKDDSGVWRSLTALIGHDRLLAWLEIDPESIANRIADSAIPLDLRTLLKSSLLDLLSEQSSLSHPRTVDLWKNICTQCDLGIGTLTTLAAGGLPGQHQRLRRLLAERVTRITVKPFMDISTMIEERLRQCCVHVGTKSDAGGQQCAPFCAVQAWPALAKQRMSTATGHRLLPLRQNRGAE
jgi:7,8-dihydro-6-hydroxymethylpterin dimethyltransferase